MNLQAAVPLPAAAHDTSAPSDRGYEERVHRFGDGLVGVATLGRPRPRFATALILLNAGLVHRMGPFRLYVQMARRLAAEGYAVLRFDQSGLGDSPRRASTATTASATRCARRWPCSNARPACAGSCSAASARAPTTASTSRRSSPGSPDWSCLDGVSYRTRGRKLRHYLPRLLNPLRVLRALWRRLVPRREPPRAVGNDDLRDFPTRDEAAGGCWRWTRAAARSCCCIPAGWPRTTTTAARRWSFRPGDALVEHGHRVLARVRPHFYVRRHRGCSPACRTGCRRAS